MRIAIWGLPILMVVGCEVLAAQPVGTLQQPVQNAQAVAANAATTPARRPTR